MTPTSTFKILICSLFLLCAGIGLQAADHGVGVTLISYSLDTSQPVNLGYTITINAVVTNYDSVPFNGHINFGLHNNEDTLTNAGIFDQPPYSGDSISLGAGETVPAIFSVNINHPYFRPGPDVVVVWPICSQPVADSILIHLTIVAPNGINDITKADFTYAVVNNTIMVKSGDPKLNFKQVRIYNDLGQKISEMVADLSGTIPLLPLSQGIYFCELTSGDGKRTTFKFMMPGNK